MEKIKLGQEVRDRVTGLQGIAVCRHTYITGCDRITVQGPVNEDRSLPEEYSFDEPTLEVVSNGVCKEQKKKTSTGGPPRYSDKGRTVGRKKN